MTEVVGLVQGLVAAHERSTVNWFSVSKLLIVTFFPRERKVEKIEHFL